MSEDRRTVVITGASGVVGRAVVQELASDCSVVALVGEDRNVPAADEIIPVDLGSDRLGLTQEAWRDLAARADAIVHSAALTTWGQAPEVYRKVNIEGTRKVMRLAQRAGAPLYYIGSCFVHAIERAGLDQLSDDNVVAPYIWSKLQAEELLRQGDVPFSIFRPTNIVGNSRTGASSRPQIVQKLSDWICWGRAPFVPMYPENRIDVVALDTVAQTIAAAIRLQTTGDLWWITQGPSAMSVDRSIELLVDHARLLGRKIEPPRVADASQLLPCLLESIPATSRIFIKVLLDVSEVTYHCGGILPDSNAAIVERLGVELPFDETSFVRSLRYWARERGQLIDTEAV